MKKQTKKQAMDEKVQENRVRRMAARQGYAVTKTRRIDRRAYDYGTYAIEQVIGGSDRRDMLSLDEIEHFLTTDDQRKRALFFKPERK
jgi:hypothetical protein